MCLKNSNCKKDYLKFVSQDTSNTIQEPTSTSIPDRSLSATSICYLKRTFFSSKTTAMSMSQ